MLRREFLIDVSILAAHKVLYPVTFQNKQEIAKPDFVYALKEMFNETIKRAKGGGTYDERGRYFVGFEIGDALYKSIYRSDVLDMDNDSEFEPNEDFGYLKNILQSPKNSKTSIDYAEISIGRALGIKTTEIRMELDIDYFNKLIKREDLFSLLHRVNRYDMYGMKDKFVGFDIDPPIKRGTDIPLDINNRIFILYNTFAEHFGIDPNLENNQV